MSEFGSVGFNPLVSGLSRSTIAQAQDDLIAENNDLRTPAEEASLASTDPAAASIEQVESTAIQGTTGAADSATTNTNAQSGQGRTVEDQVVLSSQAQQFLDRLTEQASETNQTAANNNDANSITSNPTAGAASDELTNTSRVDGNQDGQNQNAGTRERAQLIDQFA